MSGNTFGTLFRITTFGESHGAALGVVIDGCPAGLDIDIEHIQQELSRRRPGQNKLVSPRKEQDVFEVLSGIFEGKTCGTPITCMVRNTDAKSKDYSAIKDLFRPGHADFTYDGKYGVRDYRGGGRSSARETLGRVIGGAIAKQILAHHGITVRAGVIQIGSVKAKTASWDTVEENDVRSLDPDAAAEMIAAIESARKNRDSIGGVVRIQATGVPVGLGEPVFDKLDALIAGAMMSIPAVKAVEIGAGVASASLKGSEMNDELYPDGFSSNNHGGILGGISSGAPIEVRIAIKPTSSLPQELETIDTNRESATIVTKGRHDPCVVMRAVPIAETMLALVLVDAFLRDGAALFTRQAFSPHERKKYGLRSS